MDESCNLAIILAGEVWYRHMAGAELWSYCLRSRGPHWGWRDPAMNDTWTDWWPTMEPRRRGTDRKVLNSFRRRAHAAG